ncbi:putative hydrolase [Gordonia spumicola]|uniref:Putative hydrolase n=1 Tax=Gordonia spumicola TaxID=589161 RepID=A0A7I9VC51_9ACTN|nr:alpha/beta hydrolase [Gordonia spumicola]GEE02721.1 putative hydrolase [Gordonia spumicola]
MFSDLRTIARVLRNDLAPHTESESVVVADRAHGRLRRYGTPRQLDAAREAGAVPVLLVPPLAVPASCYDLAPGAAPANSVVEFLLSTGTIPYVVDFGDVGYADRRLGFEDYFDTFVPRAVADAVDDFRAGADAVDLMGWSLGGTISILTAAHRRDLPIRSVITVGTPLDYAAMPMYAAARKVLKPTGGRPLRAIARSVGVPAALVQLSYRATSWQRELRKPKYILDNIDDHDALIRMQVIDRFQDAMPGYPGRVTEQMLVNLVIGNEIAEGVLHLGDHTVDVRTLTAPVFTVGSHRDAIVSHAAAAHGRELLASSTHVEFHTVESSHLGLLTGPDAAAHTWPAIAAFRDGLNSH